MEGPIGPSFQKEDELAPLILYAILFQAIFIDAVPQPGHPLGRRKTRKPGLARAVRRGDRHLGRVGT